MINRLNSFNSKSRLNECISSVPFSAWHKGPIDSWEQVFLQMVGKLIWYFLLRRKCFIRGIVVLKLHQHKLVVSCVKWT